jgi:hypothetical protein
MSSFCPSPNAEAGGQCLEGSLQMLIQYTHSQAPHLGVIPLHCLRMCMAWRQGTLLTWKKILETFSFSYLL